MGKSALLVLSLVSLIAGARGDDGGPTVITVNDGKDNGQCSKSGVGACDLRGAMNLIGTGNTTLIIACNPVLEAPIVLNSTGTRKGDVVTLELSDLKDVGTISPSGTGYGALRYYGFPGLLRIEGIQFIGFTQTGGKGDGFGTVMVSQNPPDEGAGMRGFEEAGAGRVASPAGAPAGIDIVTLTNTAFLDNRFHVEKSATGSMTGGALTLICNPVAHEVCKLSVSSSIFRNNSASAPPLSIPSSGGALSCAGEISVTNSSFVNNMAASWGGAITSMLDTTCTGCQLDGNIAYNGAAIQAGHDIFIIRGNTAGHRAPGTAKAFLPYSIFNAGHIHLLHTLVLNTDSNLYVTSGPYDQYMEGSRLANLDGSSPLLDGFAIYSRNPLGADKLAGANPAVKFANCTEGPFWLPCASLNGCRNVQNSTGSIVGFECRPYHL